MAQLKITTGSFNLASSWRCAYHIDDSGEYWNIVYGPTTGSRDITFEFSVNDATITGAKIHATLGSPLTGAEIKTVNGVSFDSDGFAPVSIDGSATSFVATFKFKANGTSYNDDDLHSASLSFDDVYLLIEYEPNYTPPVLVDYTDSNLVQGETYVKAVHMTELHTNVNLVRVARKLVEHEFTSIVAMETSLARWNDHVLEIRSAIDEMNLEHENWIKLAENYPRLDVLLQLRRVVQTVSGSDATSPTNPANPNMLGDGSTGATYELSVADGELTMTEVEAANPPSSSILMDTVTSKAYEFKVVDGDLTMSEIESGTPSQFGTFTDTVTSTTYKLSVVDGDLTMSEA